MQDNDDRLINIEMILAEHERILEDLNQVIITQGKELERLSKQNKYLMDMVNAETVKPLSEETPPPHY